MPFRRNKRNVMRAAPSLLQSRFQQREAKQAWKPAKIARPINLFNHKKNSLDQEKEPEQLGFERVVDKKESNDGEDEQAMTEVHQEESDQRPAPQMIGQAEENGIVDGEEDKQSEVKEDEKLIPEKPKLFQKQTEEEKQSMPEVSKPALFGGAFQRKKNQDQGSGFPPSVEKKQNIFTKPVSNDIFGTPGKSPSDAVKNIFGKQQQPQQQAQNGGDSIEEKPTLSLFGGGVKKAAPFPSIKSGGLFSKKEEKQELKEEIKEEKNGKATEKSAENPKTFPKFAGNFIMTKEEQTTTNFIEDDNQFLDDDQGGKEEDEQKEKKPESKALFAKKEEQDQKPKPLFGGFSKPLGAINIQPYGLFGKKKEVDEKQSGIKKSSLFQKKELFGQPESKGFASLFENSKGNLFGKQPLFGSKKQGDTA